MLRQCRHELLAYLRSRLWNPDDAKGLAQKACAAKLRYRNDPGIADMRMTLFRIANNALLPRSRLMRQNNLVPHPRRAHRQAMLKHQRKPLGIAGAEASTDAEVRQHRIS